MKKLYFFTYTTNRKVQRVFIDGLRRIGKCALVFYSQERFYKKRWPELHAFVSALSESKNEDIVFRPVPETDWWADTTLRKPGVLWTFLRGLQDEAVVVILPGEVADYLSHGAEEFFQKEFLWDTKKWRTNEGDMFAFNLKGKSAPQELSLYKHVPLNLLETIQRSHIGMLKKKKIA